MSEKLTKSSIAALQPADKVRTIRDGSGPLLLRIQPSGRRTFIWRGRVRGRGGVETATIGPADRITLTEARQMAADAARMAAKGTNPAQAWKAQTPAETASETIPPADTLGEVARRYLAAAEAGRLRRNVRPETLGDYRQKFEYYVIGREGGPGPSELASRPISDIGPRELRRFLLGLRDAQQAAGKTGSAANGVKAALSAMFSWAVEEDIIETNPIIVGQVKAPVEVKPRERHLSDAELAALYPAMVQAVEAGSVPAAWLQFVLLTGVRNSAARNLQWEWIDWENGWIDFPAGTEGLKAGRAWRLPFGSTVRALLRRRWREAQKSRVASSYVFTTNGGAITANQAKMIDRLATASGVGGWSPHTLRHSFYTYLRATGTAQSTIDACLDHTPAGMGRVYDHHGYVEEKRGAFKSWAAHLEQLAKPRRP